MRFGRYLTAFALILTASASNIPSQATGQNSGSNTFTLGGNSIILCRYWGVEFNATEKEQLHVQWSSVSQLPAALDLYITSLSAISRLWYCDYGPEGFYTNSGAFGSFSWVPSTGGEYVLLIVNNQPKSVSGTLSITIANTTVSVAVIGYGIARQEPICPPECPEAK